MQDSNIKDRTIFKIRKQQVLGRFSWNMVVLLWVLPSVFLSEIASLSCSVHLILPTFASFFTLGCMCGLNLQIVVMAALNFYWKGTRMDIINTNSNWCLKKINCLYQLNSVNCLILSKFSNYIPFSCCDKKKRFFSFLPELFFLSSSKNFKSAV